MWFEQIASRRSQIKGRLLRRFPFPDRVQESLLLNYQPVIFVN